VLRGGAARNSTFNTGYNQVLAESGLCPNASSSRQRAVEGAAADCLVEMRLADVVVAGQVGNGAGDFEDAVARPGALRL
jgi:hypothetical protein